MKIKKEIFIFICILFFVYVTFFEYFIFAGKRTKEFKNNNNNKNIKKSLTNKLNKLSIYTPLENDINKDDIPELNGIDWGIYIPKINLIYQVLDGTDLYTLDYAVGHFKESPKDKGNICLAGHNLGIKASPFKNLNNLTENDKLYYKYKNNITEYRLKFKKEISETNFKYINNTKDNNITIITCIMSKPNKRLVARFTKGENNENKHKINNSNSNIAN